jgi:chromosome segregation ATPase
METRTVKLEGQMANRRATSPPFFIYLLSLTPGRLSFHLVYTANMEKTYEAQKQELQQEIQQFEAALEKARKKKEAIEKKQDLSEKTAKLQVVQARLQDQVAEQNARYSNERERFDAEVAEATEKLRVQYESRIKLITASIHAEGPKWEDIQSKLDTVEGQIEENEKQLSVRYNLPALVVATS